MNAGGGTGGSQWGFFNNVWLLIALMRAIIYDYYQISSLTVELISTNELKFKAHCTM